MKVVFEGSKANHHSAEWPMWKLLRMTNQRQSVRVLARVETGQRLSSDQNRSCPVENVSCFQGLGIICNTEVIKNSRICGLFFMRRKLHLSIIFAKHLP